MPGSPAALRRPLFALLLAAMALVALPGVTIATDLERAGSLERAGIIGEPVTTTSAVPPGQVGVQSQTSFSDVLGGFNVAGELLNNTSSRRWHLPGNFMGVRIVYRDGSGNVLRTYPSSSATFEQFTSYSFVLGLSAGAVSPFFLRDPSPPATFASWSLTTAQGIAYAFPPDGALNVKLGTPFTDGTNQRHYPGTVQNPNAFSIQSVDANLTVYNSAGTVIDSSWEYTTPQVIPAGGSATFDVVLPEPPPGEARWTIVAQGFRGTGASQNRVDDYVTSWANYFDDIGSSVFRNDIVWNAEQGITTGCALARFCPNANVPRDEMASFLARARGLGGAAPNAFTDDNGNLHEANINRVAQAGITTGCGGTNYCPSANVPRDQMASFLARAVGLGGTAPNAFTDDNGNLHEANINRVAQAGIASGCATGRYCPSALVTRGQMAAFLKRAFD
jgi:hypothetical protein